MLKPPALPPGGVVGIVAPASPVRREFVERGLAELGSLGFRARLGSHLYDKTRYTAGTISARLEDLIELWDAPEVDALFCARGGYGSLSLLSALAPERFREHPKVLLGSSDVTALLGFLQARAGLVSFHGPMVAQQIARRRYDAENLLSVVGSNAPHGRLQAPGVELLSPGTAAEGLLWGGCLSIVASLVGTGFLPSPEGSILFLEDTHVKPYQIDRMLTQLRLSGWLEGVRGLVFGEMPGCDQHPEQGYRLQDVLRDWTADLKIPVLYGLPSGHTHGNAMTLPFGVRARLDNEGLSLLEGAVR